jgi:PIN domain nuclease of toxin-antitoxin system
MTDERSVVLDTHVWLWLMLGSPSLRGEALSAVQRAAGLGNVVIPAIVPWELAMLERKGRITLAMPALTWIEKALDAPGVRLLPLTPAVSVDAATLPGASPGDPADRMIIATARAQQAVLVTRDAAILRYAEADHVNAVAA